jgi:hypothetical protein
MGYFYFFIIALTWPSISAPQTGLSSLTGSVLSAEDEIAVGGAAIAGAQIELRPEQSPAALYRATTDEMGIFELPGIPAGMYTMEISRLGFDRLKIKSLVVSDGRLTLPTLELWTSKSCMDSSPESMLLLRPGTHAGDLSGSVRTDPVRPHQTMEQSIEAFQHTPPVAGAKVELRCKTEKTCASTHTDSKGEFLFESLEPGTVTIRVSRPGFYPIVNYPFEVQEGKESRYRPVYEERCAHGNCDPLRRPKRPVIGCE